MPYEVHHAPGEEPDETTTSTPDLWPLWEVFVRQRRGLAHVHAGSLHAPDVESAVQRARGVCTRRSEGVSVWVVRSTEMDGRAMGNGLLFWLSSLTSEEVVASVIDRGTDDCVAMLDDFCPRR